MAGCCLTPSVFEDFSTLVPTSRQVNTTAPLTGGGPLTSDLTLGISDFVASGAGHARGAVPDPGAAAGTTKFLREDATFAVPPGTGVPTSRNVNTTAPLTGGGDLSADRTLAISAPTFTQDTGAPASASLQTAGGNLWRMVYGSVILQATAANAASWIIEVETGVATGAYNTIMSLRVNSIAVPDPAQDFGYCFMVATGRRYRFTKGGLAGTTETIGRYSFADF